GDVLKITAVRGGAVVAQLVLDCDPQTGEQRLGPEFLFTSGKTSDLAYCITGHSAQGRTVSTSTVLVTGQEDRRWFYVAMSRGALGNHAVICTEPVRPDDARPGVRPAPELARQAMIDAERAGLDA